MPGCPHGMPSFWSCGECVYGDESPPETPNPMTNPTVVATFTAQYEGDCNGCDLPIHPGQRIVRMSDDCYLHEGCE